MKKRRNEEKKKRIFFKWKERKIRKNEDEVKERKEGMKLKKKKK